MIRIQATILAMLGLWLVAPATAAERHPNIVILLADDKYVLVLLEVR
jgi:hypothetical protein